MLCPCARHFMLYLVLVQPRKHPYMIQLLTYVEVDMECY